MGFDFKQFSIRDSRCAMKVGTDGVLLGSWVPVDDPVPVSAFDLGAGSGVVAMMIAQRCPAVRVTAVEIDPGAAQDCDENFRACPFASRLNVKCMSAEDFVPDVAPDLIVSNPPFFVGGLQSPVAARSQARHQGRFGPQAVIEIASRLLSPRGSLAMITPTDNESELLFHAEMHRLHLRRLCRVSTIEGRAATRLLWQFSRIDGPQSNTTLAIRTPDGLYTSAYIALTREFYLKM